MYNLDIIHNRRGTIDTRMFPQLPQKGDKLEFISKSGLEEELIVYCVRWSGNFPGRSSRDAMVPVAVETTDA